MTFGEALYALLRAYGVDVGLGVDELRLDAGDEELMVSTMHENPERPAFCDWRTTYLPLSAVPVVELTPPARGLQLRLPGL